MSLDPDRSVSVPRRARPRHAGLAVFALLAACGLAGCKGVTPIQDLLDDPSRFKDQKVRIAGDVTQSVGVLGTGVYEVDDGTGTIPVVAKSGGVPREGAKVGVEGKVQAGFTLGTKSLTVFVEERRYSP